MQNISYILTVLQNLPVYGRCDEFCWALYLVADCFMLSQKRLTTLLLLLEFSFSKKWELKNTVFDSSLMQHLIPTDALPMGHISGALQQLHGRGR